MEYCAICNESLENGQEIVVLHQKGCDGIEKASKLRGVTFSTSVGQTVHVKCRLEFCNINCIKRDLGKKQDAQLTSCRKLRSSDRKFSFSDNCLFCAHHAKVDGRKRGSGVFPVKTGDFKNTVLDLCKTRQDSWAYDVKSRIEYAMDLCAAKAIYHHQCSTNFRTGRNVPAIYRQSGESSQHSSGRPVDVLKREAFMKVVEYLQDNDDMQLSIPDLVEKMKQYCDTEAYAAKYMKLKLEEHFGKNIFISSSSKGPSIVTLRDAASNILKKFYKSSKLDNIEEEKLRLVQTAAELIRSEIKSMECIGDTFPSTDDIASQKKNSEFIPDTLHLFLKTIFSEKQCERKRLAIGQAIIQAARPRSLLAPLQIGLAVQLHHHFGSKFLIDSLNSLGYCSSYPEVKKFERSAAKVLGIDIPNVTSEHFVQFIADNVDHNIATLDGHNTFHGMGIIATVTPMTKSPKQIPRMSATLEDVKSVGRINIQFYKAPNNEALPMIYDKLYLPINEDPTSMLDLLWKVSWPLRSPRPGWSGMMQAVSKGKYPEKSSVIFLPMIDMDPTNLSCIFSTLCFVSSEARRQNVAPILTFDQPLWWKAQLILARENATSDLHSIILCLGGFHTEMSFLGCIGKIMSGTGLSELLEMVYAPNAVAHMLSGKAVARSFRGHCLVDAALNAMITSQAYNFPLPENNVDGQENKKGVNAAEVKLQTVDDISEPQSVTGETEDLQYAIKLYDQLMKGEKSVDVVCSDTVLERVKQKINNMKAQLASNPTAQLWIQYMGMIDILRLFIKAERTGNWNLYLHALEKMLPYFAAAGHNNYAKSVHIHLQQMNQLKMQHPNVHEKFILGYHVIRRSNRFWGGLSPDLVIEQVLMRSIKTTGGLTRGRGMSEAQRAQWLLSMPACAEVNIAMQEFMETTYATSEQHKESTDARQKKDEVDSLLILGLLQERNPFINDPLLRNIVSGVTADQTVNAQNAAEVGRMILEDMVGKNVMEYTFKKKNQVVTLDHRVLVKVNGERLHVDSQLLFQRLMVAAPDVMDNIENLFQYELCSPPPSLFETNGLLRKANKPSLADAIWKLAECSQMSAHLDEESMCFVIDGGSLLQRLPWLQNTTYGSICQCYVDYINQKYRNPTVVFDGYEAGPSTKDNTHTRRSKGIGGIQVNFVEGMYLRTKKDVFLANITNKQKFINMLSAKLQEKGIKTIHATGDADVLIATTALKSASICTTTVIGEDTDLLVLLCMGQNQTAFPLIFRSEGQQISKKMKKIWDINAVKRKLGQDTCKLLPLIHAITGCDTTSRMFGIGKEYTLRKVLRDTNLKQHANVFLRKSSRAEITAAGEKLVSRLYGGDKDEGLNALRYRLFSEKAVGGSCSVQIHKLPPTAAAACYHSARTYFQCQEWLGNNLNPDDWGWFHNQGRLEPKTTDLAAAPESLLQIVHCNCKVNCDTRRCSCRKHGLECSAACGECRGVGCTNSMTSEDNFEDSEEIA